MTEFSEAWSYETLRRVRWPNGVTCPYCGRKRVTTHSKSTRTPRRRYLCRDCHRTFSDLSRTPIARTNLPLWKWLLCLELLGEARTTSEIARELGVKWDSVARMERRVVAALGRPGLLRQLGEATMEARRVRAEPGSWS